MKAGCSSASIGAAKIEGRVTTMDAKYLLGGSVAAGLTIFVWGATSHMALPLPEPVEKFKNDQLVLDAVRAQTNGNGVYIDPRGVFLALSLRPDLADKSQNMGRYLAVEGVTNLAQGFLLALVLLQVKPKTVLGYAVFGLLVGLVAWVGIDVSLWNWYGFSGTLTLFDLLDMPVGCGLAGLVLGWMIRKWKLA